MCFGFPYLLKGYFLIPSISCMRTSKCMKSTLRDQGEGNMLQKCKDVLKRNNLFCPILIKKLNSRSLISRGSFVFQLWLNAPENLDLAVFSHLMEILKSSRYIPKSKTEMG